MEVVTRFLSLVAGFVIVFLVFPLLLFKANPLDYKYPPIIFALEVIICLFPGLGLLGIALDNPKLIRFLVITQLFVKFLPLLVIVGAIIWSIFNKIFGT